MAERARRIRRYFINETKSFGSCSLYPYSFRWVTVALSWDGCPTRSAFYCCSGVPADQSIIFHFNEYLATKGGIYKSKKLMSLSLGSRNDGSRRDRDLLVNQIRERISTISTPSAFSTRRFLRRIIPSVGPLRSPLQKAISECFQRTKSFRIFSGHWFRPGGK